MSAFTDSCTICSTPAQTGVAQDSSDEFKTLAFEDVAVMDPSKLDKTQAYWISVSNPPPKIVTVVFPDARPPEGRFRTHDASYWKAAVALPSYAAARELPDATIMVVTTGGKSHDGIVQIIVVTLATIVALLLALFEDAPPENAHEYGVSVALKP